MSNTLKPEKLGETFGGGFGALLALVLLVGCMMTGLAAVLSCATLPGTKVIDGAKLVLAGLCETLPTPQLDLARQQLERNDLVSAARHLRDELAAHGHQPDVAALLALIESQLPAALAPAAPGRDGGAP